MPNETGANSFSYEELDRLFPDEDLQETPTVEQETEPTTEPQPEVNNVETTKSFAKRLSEKTEQVRKEEREAIAKSLGYESYEVMMKKREYKTIEDKGFDPEEISPLVEELVQNRINNDPRMKELENFRAQQVAEFGKRELAEITKLTDGEITRLEQLPSEVLELWKKKGSLKSAYLELEGEKLIMKARSAQSKGSTSHLANASSVKNFPLTERPLTDEEKQAWRFFHPSITDEELNKKTVKNKEK
jgi:transposase